MAEDMFKIKKELIDNDSDENVSKLRKSCVDMILKSLSYYNEDIDKEAIESMSTVKLVRLSEKIAILNSEAFIGGTDSGI